MVILTLHIKGYSFIFLFIVVLLDDDWVVSFSHFSSQSRYLFNTSLGNDATVSFRLLLLLELLSMRILLSK